MKHINAAGRIASKKLPRFFSAFALLLLLPAGFSSAAVLSTDPVPQMPAAPSSSSSGETKAKIISLEGNVKILKKNAETWQAAKENQPIEEGDQILTGQNSSVDIAYDNYLLNISHLKENTKAEIRSIDPTDIYLEDGSIFSALDGLSGKGGYQIATPTAVAAVRGTHFDVGYDKSSQKFTAASLPTGDEDHVSKIFVTDPKAPQSAGVEVIENKQLDLKFGEPIQKNMIRPADPDRLQAGKAVFAQMGRRMPKFQELRGQGKAHLQEMKQRGPGQKPGQDAPFQKKAQSFNGRQQPEKMNPGMNEENAQMPAPVDSLENVQALDDLLDSEKPQQTKPFGSFKPKPQSLYGGGENSQGQRPQDQSASNNPESGQEQGQSPMVMKPFGQMRPQSINEKGPLGNQGQMNRPGGFQQQPGGPQNQNQQQPQGKRQGPPPQGPPPKR